MSEVSLVVFAAGAGTRLRPLTELLPKAMVTVLDVPLVDLALTGTRNVAWAGQFVNVSHCPDPLREHLKNRPEIAIFDEGKEPVGTAATLRLLLPRLAGTVLTLNCDLVSDLTADALLRTHIAGNHPCTLAVRPVRAGADIAMDSGRMRLINRQREDRAGYVYLGAACFEKSLLEQIPDGVPLGLAEGLLRPALDRQQVTLHHHHGYAGDAGTPGRYLQISLDALSGHFPIEPPGILSPGRYVGTGARVEETSLGPGAIVLGGAQVDPGTTLFTSVVWPHSRVPGGLDLRRGIWHRGNYLSLA